MKRMISIYAKLLRTHPTKTQIATAGTMMLTSDIIAQKLIERRKVLDVERTAGFFFIGICYVGPFMRTWFFVLDRYLVRGTGTSAAVKKMLLGQLLVSPVYLFFFIGIRAAVQSFSWSVTKETVRAKYVNALASSYVIWPAAMVVNFRYVPLNYRILFSGVVGLVWGTFLSFMLSGPRPAL
ncbi:unnamed protein product, partial [Ixodes hexagonus]